MANFEDTNKLVEEAKVCTPLEVGRLCAAIIEGYIFLEKSEQDKIAASFYNWAEENASAKPLLFCYAKALLAFGLFYRERYDEGLPLITECQNTFSELNEQKGIGLSLLMQGGTYRTFGNVDLALKSMWEGREKLIKEEGFQFFVLACEIGIGGIYFEMKHYDDAIPLFKSTLEMAEKTGKFYWYIYALHGLGKVYMMQNKYPEAMECLEKAMEVSEKNNHPLSICNSLSELGNYYFTLGDHENAEQFHKRSLALREQNHFIGGAITNCIRLAEIYIREKQPDEAVKLLEKGLKLAEQTNVKPKMYQIHFLLSRIYGHMLGR